MSKVEKILMAIEDLSYEESDLLLKNLVEKLSRDRSHKNIVAKYVGVADGIWKNVDAQDFINEERLQARASF